MGPSKPTTKSPTLQSNIKKSPEKKDAACEFLRQLIQKGIEKGLYGFSYFQQLMSEYFAVVSGAVLRQEGFIGSLADHAIHLVTTRAGTKVAVQCVAYGTAKDRKRILKSLKGYTRSSLLHRDAYLAILQLILVTDDTVSLNKSLLTELESLPKDDKKDAEEFLHGTKESTPPKQQHPLLELALDDHASKLFMVLLISDEEVRRKCLDPIELNLLQFSPTVVESPDGKDVAVPTSKKDGEIRRKELLQYLQKPLVQMCKDHASELARSLPGSRVLEQVYKSLNGPANLKEGLVQLCVDSVSGSVSDSGDEEPVLSLLEDPVGHYLIKHLVLGDDVGFAESLIESLPLNDVAQSSSRAAFVVTAIMKASPKCSAKVKAAVNKKQVSLLLKNKGDDTAAAGFEALLKAIST